LVRWRTGGDVRSHGSGGTGATNVGRVLGRSSFVGVLLLDIAKGALTVGLARWSGAPVGVVQLVVLAVVVGHIWPVQLGFRGGKGIGPLLGAWLMYDPVMLAPCLAVALVALAVLRRLTIAGLCGLCVLPMAVWFYERDWNLVVIAVVTLTVVLFAHREHLRRWFCPHSESGV